MVHHDIWDYDNAGTPMLTTVRHDGKLLNVVAQVNNLFDHHYSTAAQLGPTGFTSTGNFIARPLPPIGGEFPLVYATFYAPGAPTTAWAGLRFKI